VQEQGSQGPRNAAAAGGENSFFWRENWVAPFWRENGIVAKVARWYIFIPKIPILVYIFWKAWGWKIFVYLMAIWYFYYYFGIFMAIWYFYGHLTKFCFFAQRNIWQPRSSRLLVDNFSADLFDHEKSSNRI
jgi:hypothetical protein